jgi:hypothetical protein
MEAVLGKFDILNLSTYQLQRIIPPSHYGVVPKLIMVWKQDSSLMDKNTTPVSVTNLGTFLTNTQ